MAEGDTILRAAKRIEAAIGGEQLVVSAPNPRGRASGVQRLDGGTLERVDARGKHLLLGFGDLTLHSHLGMSGSWHVYPQGGAWRKPSGAAWAVLRGESSEAVQFGGPTLRLLRTDALRRDPTLSRLGPDILASDFDAEAVARSLRAHPHRTLGDALLDQTLVAGIGNIFKSEASPRPLAAPWRSDRRAARRGQRRRSRVDAGRGRARSPRQRRLPPCRPGLPELRHPNRLPRPGRR